MTATPTTAMMSRITQPVITVVVLLVLVVAGAVTQRNVWLLWTNASLVESSFEFLNTVDDLEASLRDTELGQRGYIFTGDRSYLEPYRLADSKLDSLVDKLKVQANDFAVSPLLFEKLSKSLELNRLELNRGVSIRDSEGFEAAKKTISTGTDRMAMDEVRSSIQRIRDVERSRLAQLKNQSKKTYRVVWYMGLLTTIAGVGLVAGGLRMIHRRRILAERDAATIREERKRLQNALDDRQLFERRNLQLDKHIRLFVDQIQDYAIFTMDTECRATSWNMGVAKVLGFEEHEFIGRDVRPLIFTPEANANGTTSKEFALAASQGTASDDRWMMRKGPTRFWATGITSSIRDEHDQLIGYSKVMRDMTMQKQNSDELSRLASELSEESRRKNEFLATLAHELRNPLSPIKNAVQLMEMMNLDGDVNELRNTMARQVEQLVRLIDDLMDISRVGRGKLELRKEFSRMDAIVHAAVEASMPLIESNRQRIEVQIDETEMVVEADPARITQVICNLLNNAAKYSHADCKILLTVKRVEENIEIRVKDNGAGIAPDQLETIFDMYSQLGDSVERGTAGLGIGLALVRTLVELHGGTVTAHSDGEGRGSEFLVRIPATSQAAEIKTSNTPSVSDIPQRAYRVLVVEDMRALALVLARLLTKLGHHVEIVESGEAAIDKLRTLDAEVIFSDISMPMMTGYELARFLRSNEATSKIKLVAMTGYGQLSDREKAFAAGFDEHMTKPVDVQRLREFFQGLEAV